MTTYFYQAINSLCKNDTVFLMMKLIKNQYIAGSVLPSLVNRM
jgi:hypothetical protein